MSTLEKRCMACGVDVQGRKRARNRNGHYYCMSCTNSGHHRSAGGDTRGGPGSVAKEAPSLWCADAILLLARGSIGLYFLLAGMGKFANDGLSGWLEYFNSVQPAWLPNIVATPYSVMLPFVEVTIGLMAIIGLFTHRVAEVMAILVATFIIGTTGVFADGLPFHPNILILALALLITVTGPGEWSLDDLREG